MHEQLKNAFINVGCNLRKFISNSPALMSHIPEHDKEKIDGSTVKVLGMLWSPLRDTLEFNVTFDMNGITKTKCQLVSEIATIFDPLGLISPAVVKAKILLQNVWAMSNKEKKYGWDDELHIEFVDEWLKIKTRAIALNSIAVNRWIRTSTYNNVQIHGYCDASQRAYAACVYCIHKSSRR